MPKPLFIDSSEQFDDEFDGAVICSKCKNYGAVNLMVFDKDDKPLCPNCDNTPYIPPQRLSQQSAQKNDSINRNDMY